jgi:hypothetical protein
MRTGRLAARLVALAILLCAGLARAQLLSPFTAFTWTGTVNSNVVLLSHDERFLFVSNQGMGPPAPGSTVSVLAVAPDGILSLVGIFPTGSVPCGLALNPAGDRLYVATLDGIFVHAVAGDGSLTIVGSAPPLPVVRYVIGTGIQYSSLPGGDFVYQNENVPSGNLVSAYRVAADGTLEPAGSFPTGDAGSSSGLYAPPRLLAAEGGHLFAANAASVSVFDILPDGSLSLAPGSPWASPVAPLPVFPTGTAAVATDPSGGWLYATYDGVNVVRSAVGADGSLAFDALFTSDATYPITGLAVHPSGRWFASAAGGSGIQLYDTAVPGAPIQKAGGAAGILWNGAGDRLYIGGGSLVEARVRVLRFGPGGVAASCIGAPGARVVLPAPADACAVAVDAANGLAGTCADQGGGLASCTFDGQQTLLLGLGPSDVVVTATSTGGATSTCTSYVEVVDVTPPAISVAPSPAVLWPPDHRLVPIALGVAATDACDPAPVITCSASSSEPDDGVADGDTVNDVQWIDGALWLRAERSGIGPGRVYTASCTAQDASRNAASATGTVSVPHDWAL